MRGSRISLWQISYSRRSCSNILRRSRTSSPETSAEDLALLRVGELGDRLVGRFAQDFARFQAAARAKNYLSPREKLSPPPAGRKDTQMAHDAMSHNISPHKGIFFRVSCKPRRPPTAASVQYTPFLMKGIGKLSRD